MKKYNLIIPFLLLVVLFSCTKNSQEYYTNAITSDNRSINQIRVGDYQLAATFKSDTTVATGTVDVQILGGIDITALKVDVAASYNATVSPASGSTLNFANADSTQTFTVTSASGKSRVWTVKLHKFIEVLQGTFSVQNIMYTWDIGPGQSWGWGGSEPLTDQIPEVSDEYDDTYTFTFIAVVNGNLTGKVTHNHGTDGKYALFTMTSPAIDYSKGFRALPINSGTWVHNANTNVVTFTDLETNAVWSTRSLTVSGTTIMPAFNYSPNTDWGDGGSAMQVSSTEYFWWNLVKQ